MTDAQLVARAQAGDPTDRSPSDALGSVGYEPQLDAQGQRLIWLEAAVVDRLAAMRGAEESMSDVILRLAKTEAGKP